MGEMTSLYRRSAHGGQFPPAKAFVMPAQAGSGSGDALERMQAGLAPLPLPRHQADGYQIAQALREIYAASCSADLKAEVDRILGGRPALSVKLPPGLLD